VSLSELEEFLQACAEQAIYIETTPLEDAARDFNLYTAEDVMAFIVNLGLSELTEKNCYPLEKPRWRPPPPPPDISVYAYNFWASKKGVRKSYLAFYRNPVTTFWTLKSFKMDPPPDGNFPFRDPRLLELREKLLLQQKPDEEEI